MIIYSIFKEWAPKALTPQLVFCILLQKVWINVDSKFALSLDRQIICIAKCVGSVMLISQDKLKNWQSHNINKGV